MARYTLTVSFDDTADHIGPRTVPFVDDDTTWTELACSLAVNELRKCADIAIESVELTDHYKPHIVAEDTSLLPCEHDNAPTGGAHT